MSVIKLRKTRGCPYTKVDEKLKVCEMCGVDSSEDVIGQFNYYRKEICSHCNKALSTLDSIDNSVLARIGFLKSQNLLRA